MDIVERLRESKLIRLTTGGGGEEVELPLHIEAADEIERLRKEKTELIKALEFYANPYGEAECVPDFYSELDFGELAQDAIAKATGGE